MATGRNRSKSSQSGLSGQLVTSGSGTVGATVRQQDRGLSETVTCSDVVGNPHGDNNLSLTRSRLTVAPIVGPTSDEGKPNTTYVVGSPVPTFFVGNGFSDYIFWPVLPSNSTLGNQVLARTNPSRPVVDLPVFLFELKDLPGMMKQIGEAIRWVKNGKRIRPGVPKPTAAGLANANLAYQFGWVPFVSDMQKLLNFGEAVDRKREQLRRLYSKGGLRRTVTLSSQSQSFNTAVTVQSAGITINTLRKRSGSQLSWGSVRWKPDTLVLGQRKPSDWDAVKAAFGLDITLSTVWEALPWSWLIDWFTDMGDILAAHRNTIPAKYEGLCIMRREFTLSEYQKTFINPKFDWGGASCLIETKSRAANIVPSLLPTAYFPFLDNKQLSILGSLAITRIR